VYAVGLPNSLARVSPAPRLVVVEVTAMHSVFQNSAKAVVSAPLCTVPHPSIMSLLHQLSTLL
jgi:hypothetical protein